MGWGKISQPIYSNGYFSLYDFLWTWDHREIARVLDTEVVMLKSQRMARVLLTSGVVGLNFNAWGYTW
jgi:hypothetical protein